MIKWTISEVPDGGYSVFKVRDNTLEVFYGESQGPLLDVLMMVTELARTWDQIQVGRHLYYLLPKQVGASA